MLTFLSGGKPVRMDFLPAPSERPSPAVVLLHGSGGNAGRWVERLAPEFARLGFALLAPYYFDRTGTARATAQTILDGVHYPQWVETVTDALAYARSLASIEPERMALLGFSLGAFLATSVAADPAQRIRAIVELSGGLPEEDAARATAAFPPTLIVHGDADTVLPVSHAHALDALLTRLQVPHQTEIVAGQGHWFSPEAQARMLTTALEFLKRYL